MHDNFALLVFFFYIAVSPGEINSKLYLPQLFFFFLLDSVSCPRIHT